MIELSSTVPSQIRFLLHSLNEANVDSVFRDLCQVLSLHFFIIPNFAIGRLSLSLLIFFLKTLKFHAFLDRLSLETK